MKFERVPGPSGSTMQRSHAVRLSLWGILTLVGAYLLSPILTPTHVEGFTASVASLSLHLREGSLQAFDPIDPLNVEFFGLSKLGWVLMISALGAVGLSTTAAMTTLSWTAALGFAAGTVFLVRHWTGAPYWSIVAALIILPGVSETAFFFNDNIIASALAVGGLSALYIERRILGAALCGLLFGLAVLTRTDTLVIGAAVPLILLEREGISKRLIAQLLVAGFIGSAVLVATFASFGTTILDVLKVARVAVGAWDRTTASSGWLIVALYLGVPGIAFVIAALVMLTVKREWALCLRMLLVPALYLAVLWGKIWEIRQLLPLTPFLAGLAAMALAATFKSAGHRGSAAVQGLLAGFVAMALLGPPIAENRLDGPRVLAGRLENISRWRSWQDDNLHDLQLLRSLTNVPERSTRVLIADFWNEDRYSHLAIQEAGFLESRPSDEACGYIAEQYVKGTSRIVLVRLQAGYVPYWRAISGERLRRFGIPCIDGQAANDIIFLARADRLDELSTSRMKLRSGDRDQNKGVGTIRALRLERGDFDALLEAYDKDRVASFDPDVRTGTIEDAIRATRRNSRFGV